MFRASNSSRAAHSGYEDGGLAKDGDPCTRILGFILPLAGDFSIRLFIRRINLFSSAMQTAINA